MKKKINLIFIIFFINLFTKAQASTIAYVDLDLLLQNSMFGQKIFNKLEEEKKDILKALKTKENEIKSLDSNINAKKNIISNNELNLELNKLQNEIQNYEIYKKEIQNEYEEIKKKEILFFFKEIDPYIQEYLSKNSIDILFNNKNIIIGKDSLDITEKIITIIDKEIK